MESRAYKPRCLRNLTWDKLYELIVGPDKKVIVPLSCLESASSDCVGSDVDCNVTDLGKVKNFVVENDVRNDSPRWNSYYNIVLEIVRNTKVSKRKPLERSSDRKKFTKT